MVEEALLPPIMENHHKWHPFHEISTVLLSHCATSDPLIAILAQIESHHGWKRNHNSRIECGKGFACFMPFLLTFLREEGHLRMQGDSSSDSSKLPSPDEREFRWVQLSQPHSFRMLFPNRLKSPVSTSLFTVALNQRVLERKGLGRSLSGFCFRA